jgi:lathosterol oxidase
MENSLLLIVIVVLLLAERLPALRFEPLPVLRPHFATDAFYLLTSGVLLALAMRAAAVRAAATEAVGAAHAAVASSLTAPAPAWLAHAGMLALALVVYDLGAYVSHRLLHRVDVLWRIHKVHHSSRTLDWLATFRGHVLEHVLRNALSPVLMILLGFPLAAVAFAAAVYAASSVIAHSNLGVNLAFLEPVLITPRLHRLHHVVETSDKNFGTLFSFWDRLAGVLVTGAPAGALGVPGEVESYPQTWARQLVEPFRPRSGARSAVLALASLATGLPETWLAPSEAPAEAGDGARSAAAASRAGCGAAPLTSSACSSRNAV